MKKSRILLAHIVIAVCIGGHVFVHFQKKAWPFSTYDMFSRLITDYKHSGSFAFNDKFRSGNKNQVALFVLKGLPAGGNEEVLLFPNSRLRRVGFLHRNQLVIELVRKFRKNQNLNSALRSLFHFYNQTGQYRAQKLQQPIRSIKLYRYVWFIDSLRASNHLRPNNLELIAEYNEPLS